LIDVHPRDVRPDGAGNWRHMDIVWRGLR
jgi:hypothetical protein